MSIDIDQLLNDLSPHRPVLTLPGADSDLAGKCVMVTGAGGSIGSEIVRCLASIPVRCVVMAGRSELGLFNLQHLPRVVPVLLDITDRDRLTRVLAQHEPEVVFHAAAHKHVPLLEDHPGEAVKNNFFGTVNVIDACCHANIESLVIVSTDKAINPTSVMGATKRAGEMYALWRAMHGMSLNCVRFGNVLGSSGSVLPIFERQILAEQPLTITHPDMDRYFMSAREAALLTIAAATRGLTGYIFTIDMGHPVKIVDLARTLMRRMGQQASIAYAGVRPGEKIHEELQHGSLIDAGGGVKAYPIERFGSECIRRMTAALRRVIDAPGAAVRAALRECVPEYQPEEKRTEAA